MVSVERSIVMEVGCPVNIVNVYNTVVGGGL